MTKEIAVNTTEFFSVVERVYAFHGRRAPGIVIGVAMVHKAVELLGNVKKQIAFVETRTCLPDVVQYLCGCTIGNGDLRMVDQMGKYAFSLFNKDTGNGIRVFIDINKISLENTPELYKFFLRRRDPVVLTSKEARKASGELVVKEFLTVADKIIGSEKVSALDLSKPELFEANICLNCKESFTTPSKDNNICPHCSQEFSYYKICEQQS